MLELIKQNEQTIEGMEQNIEKGYMADECREIIDILVAENAQLKNELAETGAIII